jgi:hypothetical protein
MVFIINRTKSAASKVSGDVQRRCTSLILGSAGRRKNGLLGEKRGKPWGKPWENHGIVLGKTMGNTKKEAHGFLPNMSKVPEMFFPFNQWDYRKQVMPIERRIERHLWHRFGPLLSFSQCFIQTSCKCHMNFVLL